MKEVKRYIISVAPFLIIGWFSFLIGDIRIQFYVNAFAALAVMIISLIKVIKLSK